MPGANWRAALLKKDMPLILNRFGGWLNYPEYFFFWCYHGQNAVFNTMSYQNADDGQADRRPRASSREQAQYDGDRARTSSRWRSTRCRASRSSSPCMDVAMQQNIRGYTYWFHWQPDYRQLVQGAERRLSGPCSARA